MFDDSNDALMQRHDKTHFEGLLNGKYAWGSSKRKYNF
jgi:hypothetical protein